MFGTAAAGVALALATAFADASPTVEKADLEFGVLACEMTGSSNNIIVSERTFTCTFDAAIPGMADQTYSARIEKIGLDLKVSQEARFAWVVLAPSYDAGEDALEGRYTGVSADAAIGGGLGARAMVGGLDRSITLTPLSISEETGFGIAAGIERLELVHEG
ncbi:MAG: DUF992 domain-containing protein [Pseudomonadota bacterium]